MNERSVIIFSRPLYLGVLGFSGEYEPENFGDAFFD